MRNDIILEAVVLTRSFQTVSGQLDVLKSVEFKLKRGKMAAFVGASGVGKSTLLHILGALDPPTSGKVLFNSVDIYSLSERELAVFRNKTIGFVFQFYNLLGEFTALENVMLPGLIEGKSYSEAQQKGVELLKEVDLSFRVDHKPGQLSGGEQQRVAVARALANDPEVIIADEPTGNLDSTSAEELVGLFRKLNENRKVTFIIATHNTDLAYQMDEVYRLQDGRTFLQKA